MRKIRPTAEPLIYYIGKTPAGYLYRCNKRKDIFSSLNSTDCEFHDVSKIVDVSLWSIVGKLAVLALAKEISSVSILANPKRLCHSSM